MKYDIDSWKKLIDRGIVYKEKFGNSKRWATYRAYGRGEFPGFLGSSSGILPYNITYAMKRGMVPNVYFRNPYVNVTPTNIPGADIQARLWESVDNYLIAEIGIKETFKLMIQDAYYTGRGICKLGFDGLLSKGPINIATQLAEALNTPIDQLGKNKKELVEYDTNKKPGYPWVDRVMPDFIIVPFGVRTLIDCPWIDHVVFRTLDDVKNDKKYKNTDGLEGTHTEYYGKNGEDSRFFTELVQNNDIIEIHEIRDYKHRQICAFVPGYDKWLREPTNDVLQIDGLPFVDFTFNEDCEYYWNPSDVQIIEPQQLELNEVITQAMKHRRIALAKFLVDSNSIDDKEIEKMLSEEAGPYIKTKGNPNQSVMILQPHIPPDLVQWPEVIRSHVRELLGQGQQQLGEAPPGRRSATEMRDVQDNSDIRLSERRDIVADALKNVVYKLNNIVQTRWDTDKITQIVGIDGARYWVYFKATQNKMDCTLRVDVESMTPRTKNAKKREIIELITALGNNPRANVDYLMRMLLREYDWIDAMQVFPPAPEMMSGGPMGQQQFMQQQQQLMQNPAALQKRAQSHAQMVGKVI
jgi:hypothetical protein